MNAGGVRPRPLRPIGKLLAEDTRRHHRSLILQHLFAEGPASRADLARATGLTRVTVSDLVGGLIADGLLGELGAPAESKVGKPPTLVGLLPDATHIVALDLSSLDRMAGAVVNLSGQVKERVEVPLDGDLTARRRSASPSTWPSSCAPPSTGRCSASASAPPASSTGAAWCSSRTTCTGPGST